MTCNDVTASNRVNLVDPCSSHCMHACACAMRKALHQRLVTLNNAHQRNQPWPTKKSVQSSNREEIAIVNGGEQNLRKRDLEKKEIGKTKAEQGIGNFPIPCSALVFPISFFSRSLFQKFCSSCIMQEDAYQYLN